MVTRLQRLVEIVEDRHRGECVDHCYDFKSKRGSVLNATPKELDMIRQLSFPMDMNDNGHNHYLDFNSHWKAWLREHSLSKRQNA